MLARAPLSVYIINWEDESSHPPDFFVMASDWTNMIGAFFYLISTVLYIYSESEGDGPGIAIASLELIASMVMTFSAVCAVRSWCGGWTRGGWDNAPPSWSPLYDSECAATTLFLAGATIDMLNSAAHFTAVVAPGNQLVPIFVSKNQTLISIYVEAIFLADSFAYMAWWRRESAETAAEEAAAAAEAAARRPVGELGGGKGEKMDADGYDVLGSAARFVCSGNPRALGDWELIPRKKIGSSPKEPPMRPKVHVRANPLLLRKHAFVVGKPLPTHPSL